MYTTLDDELMEIPKYKLINQLIRKDEIYRNEVQQIILLFVARDPTSMILSYLETKLTRLQPGANSLSCDDHHGYRAFLLHFAKWWYRPFQATISVREFVLLAQQCKFLIANQEALRLEQIPASKLEFFSYRFPDKDKSNAMIPVLARVFVRAFRNADEEALLELRFGPSRDRREICVTRHLHSKSWFVPVKPCSLSYTPSEFFFSTMDSLFSPDVAAQ